MKTPTLRDMVFDYWRVLLESDPGGAERCIGVLGRWVLPEIGDVLVDDLRVGVAVSFTRALAEHASVEEAGEVLRWLRNVFLFAGVLLRCEECGGAAFEHRDGEIRCMRCHTVIAPPLS